MSRVGFPKSRQNDFRKVDMFGRLEEPLVDSYTGKDIGRSCLRLIGLNRSRRCALKMDYGRRAMRALPGV